MNVREFSVSSSTISSPPMGIPKAMMLSKIHYTFLLSVDIVDEFLVFPVPVVDMVKVSIFPLR